MPTANIVNLISVCVKKNIYGNILTLTTIIWNESNEIMSSFWSLYWRKAMCLALWKNYKKKKSKKMKYAMMIPKSQM